MRLLTIPMSHYCEKARWGLERLGCAYTEERHLQGFHYPRAYRLSGGPYVPILVDGGQTIAGSAKILAHLDRYATPGLRLYPEDTSARREVDALERLFDDELGVESRRWVYFGTLGHPGQFLDVAGQGVSAWERALFRALFPFLRGFARRRLRVSTAEVDRGLAHAREIVDQTDGMLGDGRKYLVGGRFTAADLSLACMLAPLVLPREYGIRLPTIEELPAPMQPTVKEFSETATGEYVLRLFEIERGRRGAARAQP